jgi:hypothetical protein
MFFAARIHKLGLVLWGLLEGILCSGPETLATQSLWFFFSYSREATGAQVPGRLNYTNFASHQEHKFETKKHNFLQDVPGRLATLSDLPINFLCNKYEKTC